LAGWRSGETLQFFASLLISADSPFCAASFKAAKFI